MLYRQRPPRGLQLGIDREANALISSSGGEAYWVARRRAEEASSEDMAKGWSVVAATIARKTGRRQSLLGMMFH
jgi:hypothetical protein